MLHGHATDTDVSSRHFYDPSAAGQDWLLGTAADGSVTVWLAERLGEQPRRHPECNVRATLVRTAFCTRPDMCLTSVWGPSRRARCGTGR
jgi:hypothetical protein